MQFLTLFFATTTLFSLCSQALPLVERNSILGFNGVTYTGRHADGSCQSTSEIASNIKTMKASGISSVRIYAQECELLPTILKTIKATGGGMTVAAGVWIDGSSNDDAEISRLKSVLGNKNIDTSPISAIFVGNEVLFNNIMPSSQLVAKVKTVKSFAKGIPVGSVEIDGTYSSDLMEVSDVLAVNIHPYFSGVDISEAYDNLETRYNNFKKTAGGKKVLITETGWPSAGESNGKAVASVANEKIFANAVSQSSLPYYYFEWTDASWKGSSVEGHFGILNSIEKSKF